MPDRSTVRIPATIADLWERLEDARNGCAPETLVTIDTLTRRLMIFQVYEEEEVPDDWDERWLWVLTNLPGCLPLAASTSPMSAGSSWKATPVYEPSNGSEGNGCATAPVTCIGGTVRMSRPSGRSPGPPPQHERILT